MAALDPADVGIDQHIDGKFDALVHEPFEHGGALVGIAAHQIGAHGILVQRHDIIVEGVGMVLDALLGLDAGVDRIDHAGRVAGGAAEMRVRLDQHHARTGLAGLDRGRQAGGAGADDDHVEIAFHDRPPPIRPPPRCAAGLC
jgi:hypothetical protein